ncbi:MAG: pyruvate carboxylase subunit B, partial [Oscillospiraceae bacterium]
VLSGARYKLVSNEVKAYLHGEYGHAPGEVNPALIKQVWGDVPPITGRYADSLAPAFEDTKKKLGAKAKSDEDVLTYIAFPQLAETYFEKRDNPAAAAAAEAAKAPAPTAARYSVRRAD